MTDSPRYSILLALICGIFLVSSTAFRGPIGLEFRTAYFVRDILQNGPSLIPRLDGAPYFDYPPLYFLAAALAARSAGVSTPLSLALPGILSAMGTVYLTCLLAGRAGRALGAMAGTALVVTPIFSETSSQAIVDPMLTFFITLALVAYFRYLSSGAPCHFVLACAGLAGGVLTKGPIGAAIPASVVLAYLLTRKLWSAFAMNLMRIGAFLLIFSALCFIVVALAEGGAAFRELIDAQLFDRVMDEPNAAWTYYLGVFLAGFAPWSLFAAVQLFRRSNDSKSARHDILVYSRVWLLMSIILLTLASIKHTRYLLPAAPPTAILCAAFWDGAHGLRGARYFSAVRRWIKSSCIALLAAGTLAAIAAPIWVPFASMSLALAIPAAGLLALATVGRRPPGDSRAVFYLLAWTIAVGFLIYCQFALPGLSAREDAAPFVEAVEREAEGRPVLFFGIRKEYDGSKYIYWSRGRNEIKFAATADEVRSLIASQGPALLIAPVGMRALLELICGDTLRFLFEGKLGKRRCAVFMAGTVNVIPQQL